MRYILAVIVRLLGWLVTGQFLLGVAGASLLLMCIDFFTPVRYQSPAKHERQARFCSTLDP